MTKPPASAGASSPSAGASSSSSSSSSGSSSGSGSGSGSGCGAGAGAGAGCSSECFSSTCSSKYFSTIARTSSSVKPLLAGFSSFLAGFSSFSSGSSPPAFWRRARLSFYISLTARISKNVANIVRPVTPDKIAIAAAPKTPNCTIGTIKMSKNGK